MQGKIIDIHCHVLPGIDDGPDTWDESLKMVKQAVEQGVGGIIATPHYIPGEIEYKPEVVFEKVATLQEMIDREGLECKIYPGMELYLMPELIKIFDKGEIITLAGSKYVLVEFPNREITENLINLLHEIRIRGYYPIIAHPERNKGILENPDVVNDILEHRVLFQVNAGSVIGKNGKASQKMAKSLIKQRLVSFIASDAHSSKSRSSKICNAKEFLQKTLKSESTKELFSTNGDNIVKGFTILSSENKFKEKRGLLSSFKKTFF